MILTEVILLLSQNNLCLRGPFHPHDDGTDLCYPLRHCSQGVETDLSTRKKNHYSNVVVHHNFSNSAKQLVSLTLQFYIPDCGEVVAGSELTEEDEAGQGDRCSTSNTLHYLFSCTPCRRRCLIMFVVHPPTQEMCVSQVLHCADPGFFLIK